MGKAHVSILQRSYLICAIILNAARNMYKRWLNVVNSPADGIAVGEREGLSHKPVETGAAGHMSNRCLSSVVEAGISVGYAPE